VNQKNTINGSHMSNELEVEALKNNKNVIEIARGNLPASCPPHSTQTWDLHPRVVLAFDDNDKAQCPYCGAQYLIV
jgi:uncharacterized Zn-finger protein